MTILLSLALASIAFAVAIGGAEMAARYWLKARKVFFVWTPHFRHEMNLSPEAFPNFPSPARFVVNSEGERGEEVPHRAAKLFRILVAGGSAPECYVLDQEASWPMLLQRTLSRPENLDALGASHVHVGNIGKSGVGAEALDFILRMILPRMARLDAIILMVGGSDVFHWLQASAPETPAREVIRETNLSNYFGWQPVGPFRWNVRRMALTEIARRLHQVLVRPVRRSAGMGEALLRASERRSSARDIRLRPERTEVWADNFEWFLGKAIRTAKTKADRVIVARQPWLSKPESNTMRWERLWHGAVGDVFHDPVDAFYSSEALCQLMTILDQRAVKAAEEFGVESCEFRSAIEPSFDSYYDLIHFTPAGAAAVARKLAVSILHEHRVPPSRRSSCVPSSRSAQVLKWTPSFGQKIGRS